MADELPTDGENIPVRPIGAPAPPSATALFHDDKMRVLYPDDPPREDEPKPPAHEEAKPADTRSPVTVGEYKLAIPEGFEASPELLKEATPVFRELGLTSESANKLMPLGAKLIERHETAKLDEFDGLTKTWARQSREDPEIGRGKWNDTERFMGIALAAAGVGPKDEFRQLMNESGLGNHPAVVRVFRRLGEKLSRVPAGQRDKRSRSEILYPNG